MWMIDPTKLCRKHLIGEHGEIHKFRHSFVKKHNMTGRLKAPSQIEPYSMKDRHDALAAEMIRRGYNHKSPYEMPDVSHLPDVKVDIEINKKDLSTRCKDCKERIFNKEAIEIKY
jgi:hypothetical protein